jgi:hypothetical protein
MCKDTRGAVLVGLCDVNEKFLEMMARRPRAELIGRNAFAAFRAVITRSRSLQAQLG